MFEQHQTKHIANQSQSSMSEERGRGTLIYDFRFHPKIDPEYGNKKSKKLLTFERQ